MKSLVGWCFAQVDAIKELLDDVVDNYASISASKLSEWSHTVGSPWERTTLEHGFTWSSAYSLQIYMFIQIKMIVWIANIGACQK